MSIKNSIIEFQRKLGEEVTLVAVSKTKPNSDIIEAYDAGQRDFGENKVQELAKKAEELPEDIHWHMIGHLQRNKVKYIAPFVYLIHSVDSEKLLKEINKRASTANRIINCLLQVHIAEEDTKFGWDEDELNEFLLSGRLQEYPNICVRGLMGMATFTEDEAQVRREFQSLKSLFDQLSSTYSSEQLKLDTLSMGMSGDYEWAIDEGSTMVRVGSAIFGARNYNK